jgi:hypothetical protein
MPLALLEGPAFRHSCAGDDMNDRPITARPRERLLTGMFMLTRA